MYIQDPQLLNAMQNIYKDNLNTLKHIDNQLYKKIISFDANIKTNKFTQQYEIRFYNNSLNIYNKKTNTYLYNKSLEEDTNNIIKQYANFDTINILNDFVSFFYDIKHLYGKRPFSNIGHLKLSEIKIQQDILEYRRILNFPIVNRLKKVKYIPNFIYFGTLLGYHIPKISQKLKPKKHLIIEPNLEIFYLSLFITEYKILLENGNIFFCINENQLNTIKIMESFIRNNLLEDYMFKYYSTSYHSSDLINDFYIAMENATYFAYDHYRQLEYTKDTIDNINKYRLLQYQNPSSNQLVQTPILVLSPGPSLRQNIKFVKQNQQKFILIAFSATLNLLAEYNIVPDVVIVVDSSEVISKQFPINKKYLKKLKKSFAILSTNTHKKIFKFFKQKNIFTFESIFKISPNGIPNSSAFTVGDSTLHILLSLKFTNIYLLGTDLSIDKNGSGYDKSHLSSKTKININNNIKPIQKKIIKQNTIQIKANFGTKQLYTTQFFLRILKSYKMLIELHNNYKYSIYNLSNGAYIDYTIPLLPTNIKIKNKIPNKKKLLKNILKNSSIKGFDKLTKNKINKELKSLYALQNTIFTLTTLNIKSYKELYNFIQNDILTYIIKNKNISSATQSIIISYINLTINYLTYYFNDITIEESPKTLNNIKDIFYKQFSNILNFYIKQLKKI